MPLLKHCQYCGAQSTTLESYFQWTVCSGCAATLRGSQSARASTAEEPRRKAKRARCNCCGYLKPREQLHKFYYHIEAYRTTYYGKLICVGCEHAMLTPCTKCGGNLHASDINDAYAAGVCFTCRAGAERARAQQQTYCRKCGRPDMLISGICGACITRGIYEEFLAAAQSTTSQAPRHARTLSEYAGERLEWPCSSQQLKRVWRSAARRTHPDMGGSSEAFQAAKASYDALAEVAR